VGGRYALVRCCPTSGKIGWKYFFAKKCCNISKNVGTFSKMLLKTFWDPSVFVGGIRKSG
jgi:hypothetical protein